MFDHELNGLGRGNKHCNDSVDGALNFQIFELYAKMQEYVDHFFPGPILLDIDENLSDEDIRVRNEGNESNCYPWKKSQVLFTSLTRLV